MKLSKTNKIIIVAGAFFILFTVIIGVVLRTEKNNLPAKEIELVSDYEIAESSSGKIVESKQTGFSVSLPADWIVRDFDDKVRFSNSEIQIEPGKDVSETIKENNICSGIIEIKKYLKADHKDITSLAGLIKQVEAGEKGQDRNYAYSLVEANNRTFLKTEFSKDNQVVYISAKTIANSNIYHLNSGLFFSEECEQAFNNILQSVKIK